MSERSNVSTFAVWVGGQLKAVRGYVDQQINTLQGNVATQISAANAQLKGELTGGADSAHDSFLELQQLMAADQTQAAAIATALGKRVRVDAVQTFTAPEQAQGRANLAAVSVDDLGAVEVDYVAVAVAAMNS